MNNLTRFLFPVLAASALLTGGCTDLRGTGVPAEESRTVGAFTEVEVDNRLTVHVTSGAASTAVRLRGDDNLVPLVITDVSGARLRVRVRDGRSLEPSVPLVVEVSSPRVAHVAATGASTVRVGGLDAQGITLVSSGDSRLTATGRATAVTVTSSGGSNVDAASLTAGSARVDVSGRSRGTLRVSSAVEGSVEGGSSLTVLGSPTVRGVRTGGGSTVEYE